MSRSYYKNMDIWKISYNLVLDIYKIDKNFPEEEKKTIASQLKRAAISIPLNIAEGSSRMTNKEFLYFINYAFGSAKEVEVLLNLSRDLKFIDARKFNELHAKLDHLMAKLFSFMNYLGRKCESKKMKFFQKFRKEEWKLKN